MSTVPVLDGGRVKLRPPTEGDAEVRLSFGQDADIAEMYGVSRNDVRPMTRENALLWVQTLSENPHAWIIESGGAAIGEIRLERVNFHDRRAFMAIGIFDPASLGSGLGTDAIRLLLEHAFKTLELHRISIRVLAYNSRAIRAYRKCGFREEGRERETAFVNGQWHDDIMMGLLDYEFLPR